MQNFSNSISSINLCFNFDNSIQQNKDMQTYSYFKFILDNITAYVSTDKNSFFLTHKENNWHYSNENSNKDF